MTHPTLPAAARLTLLVGIGLMILLLWGARPRAETEAGELALWSPYWSVRPGFTSTLEMKNNLAEEGLTVHVWVYSAAGQEQYLEAVRLEPRQTALLNLNSAIAALPAPVAASLGKQGSAKVTFSAPHPSNLMGAITVSNPEQGIAWNFRLYPSFSEMPAVPVRGLFWLYDDETDGLVAAQNSSEEFITLHPSFDIAGVSHALPPVPLAPGQSFLFALRKELETLGLSEVRLGGIEFTYEGPGDAVQAHGVLFNKQGFSAEIDFHRFTQWEERRDFTRRTPRFAIGPADPALGLPAPTVFEPVLLLHNFNRHPLEVTLAVGYRAPDGPQETQLPLQLSAGESQIIELAAHLTGIVPPDAHWASLELGYSDWHNGLAAALVSVSQDGEHSLTSVLNRVVGTNHEGWYWQVDADRNTLLAIFNRRPEAVTVAVSLDYSADGVAQSYDLPERTIPGRSTDMVDIGEVIAAGAPDEDGDVIPVDVTFGGYRVRKLGPDEEGALTTEALVLDRRRKTYTTYYNTGCCFISPPRLNPITLSGAVGGSGLEILQLKNACTSAWESALNPFYWSDNGGVATIGSSSGDANLVAPGSTLLWGRARYFEDRPWECLLLLRSDDTPTTVNPKVTISCNKAHLALGSTAPANTKTGSCTTTASPAGGSYSWSVNKTTITLTPSGGSASYTAAAQSTGTGDTVITVTYTVNNRPASAQSAPITVHKPTDLFVESDTTNPTGKTCNVTCLNGSPGCSYQSYLRTRIYVVRDHLSQLFPNVSIDPIDGRESFSGFTSTCGASPPVTGSSPVSRFPDDFSFCAPNCQPGGPGCTASATQSITVNGLPVRTVSVNWSCTGVTLVP